MCNGNKRRNYLLVWCGFSVLRAFLGLCGMWRGAEEWVCGLGFGFEVDFEEGVV